NKLPRSCVSSPIGEILSDARLAFVRSDIGRDCLAPRGSADTPSETRPCHNGASPDAPMIRLALIALLFATPAAADGMAFFLKNQHARAVAVELYGRQTVWPGNDQVYLLERAEKKSVPITCAAGETICWAAWVNGDAGTF